MRSQFYPGQFGKSLQSSLGHPISSQTAMSLMPCNRRHDDHSTFYIIPDHRFCSFLTKKKTSLQVEMYQFMKRSEEHTSELQSRGHLVCRLLLEKKKTK